MEGAKKIRRTEIELIGENSTELISLYLTSEINTAKKLEKALQRARTDWKKNDRTGYGDTLYCLKETWKRLYGENVPFVFTLKDALKEIPEEYLLANGIAFDIKTTVEAEKIRLDATKSALKIRR